MGMASSKSKQRWNAANYVQVNVSLRPETAEKLKAGCKAEGISMASAITRMVNGRAGAAKPTVAVDTRQKRRKLLKILIPQIEAIAEAERSYMEAIPDNLQGACFYEMAEETVSKLEEALEILSEAY